MPHLRTKDLDIAFFETGAQHGSPVLLLHGWSDDATTWTAVADRLKDRHLRFVIPYLRGFGPSTFRNENTPRTANGGILAMDAIALMDGLGIERFSVAVHDWGSHITQCLAIGWPDRVEKIVQLSSTPRMGVCGRRRFAVTTLLVHVCGPCRHNIERASTGDRGTEGDWVRQDRPLGDVKRFRSHLTPPALSLQRPQWRRPSA